MIQASFFSEFDADCLPGRSGRNCHAFTLMELLTVLAIIGILFIIVTPSIQKARLKTASASCQNNIRQFNIALNQYMEANNGYFISREGYAAPAIIRDSEGRVLSDDGVAFDPGAYSPADPGYGGGQAWIGGLVFPYIYNLTNTYDALTWGNYTENMPLQVPFYNRGIAAEDTMSYFAKIRNTNVVIYPEQWPTYCPSTINGLRVFTTRRTRMENVPNAEMWAVNNPKGFKGFGHNDRDEPAPDMGRFTTYGVNMMTNVIGRHRGQIPGNVVAFSDWNYIYGWWGGIVRDRASWGFNNTRIGASIGVLKPGNRLGCFTEMGFHHPGAGDQMAANAVLFSGNVITILSNQASSNIYWQ